MNKPTKKKIEILDYRECMDYLEKKYNFKERDFLGLFGPNRNKLTREIVKRLGGDYKDLEEDLTKADKDDPEVKRKLAFRSKVYKIQKQEEPLYLDFWHWVCDNKDVSNGGTIYFDKSDLDQDLSFKDPFYAQWKDDPEVNPRDKSHNGEWIKTILTYILDEFGVGENKECRFETSW